MRYFLKELLEPVTYVIYGFILFAAYAAGQNRLYKLLAWYYVFAALMLFLANAENDAGRNSDWNYNLLFVACICIFSWYYYHLCQSPVKKRFILHVCLANVAAFLYTNLVSGLFFTYNNYNYAFAFICILIYSFFYYQQLLQHVSEKSILLTFDFWLVSANLFYFMGAFIVVLCYDYTDLHIRGELWGMQSVVLFISCLIAVKGYLVMKKNSS